MYDIYMNDMEFEQCVADKEHISLIVPYAVLHFVLSGIGYVNGEKVGNGTVFITAKDSHVCYYPDENNPWSYIYVRLSGPDIEKIFSIYNFSDGTRLMPFTAHKELENLMSFYTSVIHRDKPYARKILANALFLLFEKDDQNSSIGAQERNFQNIKGYIDTNFYKKISVEDIASRFFLSKQYIRNLFVKFLKISPKQYIQKLRMERAKELLSSTSMNIKSISHSVGYDDQLLFSKLFKNHTGLSPQNYRAKK